MDEPVVLRIVRPYANEAEFLAAEAWTLDAKGALLLEQAPLPTGALVRFDVVLSSGERLIRAEGRVVKAVAATGSRPGGLRVRFTRFGGSSKTLIDRVVAERRRGASEGPAAASAEVRSSVRAAIQPVASSPPPSPAPARTNAQASAVAASTDPGNLQRALRHRSVRQVVPPENRDELLDRLRQRARKLPNAS